MSHLSEEDPNSHSTILVEDENQTFVAVAHVTDDPSKQGVSPPHLLKYH